MLSNFKLSDGKEHYMLKMGLIELFFLNTVNFILNLGYIRYN